MAATGRKIGKTLNAANLEALGASRLADLLLEISTGSAVAKRRLRLELAAAIGTDEVALEIRKRFAALRRGGGFIGWRRRKAFAKDLEAQRVAIATTVAAQSHSGAHDLIWELIGLAGALMARTDDNGDLAAIFAAAAVDAGQIAQCLQPDPLRLAERAFGALADNGHGQFNALVSDLAPALGGAGMAALKALISRELAATEPKATGRTEGRRPTEAFVTGVRLRASLQAIVDAEGDVDGYIALMPQDMRRTSVGATAIATRLMAAGRSEEALVALNRHDPPAHHGAATAWFEARLACLEALGRQAEAQALRWEDFSRHLTQASLRDHLRRLPDFDDIEVERRALDLAAAHPDAQRALAFLLAWPSPDRAARLVKARVADLDGEAEADLTGAADLLQSKYPLAAVLLLRRLVDATLARGRTRRFSKAAGQMRDATMLAAVVDDWAGHPDHNAYVAHLRRTQKRHAVFWAELG